MISVENTNTTSLLEQHSFAKTKLFVYYFGAQIYCSYYLHGRSIRGNKPWSNQPTRAISHQNTAVHKNPLKLPGRSDYHNVEKTIVDIL